METKVNEILGQSLNEMKNLIDVNVEGLFSIKVYKIFKYLIRKRRKNGNKS